MSVTRRKEEEEEGGRKTKKEMSQGREEREGYK